MKIMLSCFACDPTRGSECFVGWNWATQVYAGVPKIVLTRTHHRAALENQGVAETEFAYFELPFCQKLSHHNPIMKLYYVAWQFAVLPYAMFLAFNRRVTVVQHLTYNTLDFPGVLWMIPGTHFIWGPVGGGQVPPRSLKTYYGRDWKRQLRRMFVKRMSWANPLLRLALRRARLVFAANTDTLRILEPLIPDAKRLHRLLETAIHSVGSPKSLGPGVVRVVWVGRFELRKAPRLAIEIARRIEQIAPGRFVLRMIGEGEMWQEIHDFAAGEGNVTVGRPVPFSEMPGVYREADILLFTSLQDTSGNVVLESLANGVPVLALDHHGSADMLRAGGGILVPVGDLAQVIEGFCAGLLMLAAPQTYAAMSAEGVRNVGANFLWSAKRAHVRRLFTDIAILDDVGEQVGFGTRH